MHNCLFIERINIHWSLRLRSQKWKNLQQYISFTEKETYLSESWFGSFSGLFKTLNSISFFFLVQKIFLFFKGAPIYSKEIFTWVAEPKQRLIIVKTWIQSIIQGWSDRMKRIIQTICTESISSSVRRGWMLPIKVPGDTEFAVSNEFCKKL